MCPQFFYSLFLWPSACHWLRKWLIDRIGTRQNKDATKHLLSDLQWSNWLTLTRLLFSRWFVVTFSWLSQVLTVEVSWGRDEVIRTKIPTFRGWSLSGRLGLFHEFDKSCSICKMTDAVLFLRLPASSEGLLRLIHLWQHKGHIGENSVFWIITWPCSSGVHNDWKTGGTRSAALTVTFLDRG